MIANLHQYQRGIDGIRQHLIAEGIDPNTGQPMPRVSRNPLLQSEPSQDASILPPPQLPVPPPQPQGTRWGQPEPQVLPQPQIERDVVPVEHWQEIMYRPAMASAMMYVLMPVIEQAVNARTPEEASAAIDQMDTWMKLTLAQRVALTDIFRWLEIEITSGSSVIPHHLLSNMQRASEAYDGGR